MINIKHFQCILFLLLLLFTATNSYANECPVKEALKKITICVKNGLSEEISFNQFPNDWGSRIIKPDEAVWVSESSENEDEYIFIEARGTYLLRDFLVLPCTSTSQFPSSKFVGTVVRGCN